MLCELLCSNNFDSLSANKAVSELLLYKNVHELLERDSEFGQSCHCQLRPVAVKDEDDAEGVDLMRLRHLFLLQGFKDTLRLLWNLLALHQLLDQLLLFSLLLLYFGLRSWLQVRFRAGGPSRILLSLLVFNFVWRVRKVVRVANEPALLNLYFVGVVLESGGGRQKQLLEEPLREAVVLGTLVLRCFVG